VFSNTTGSSNWIARGIKNLLVLGYGATISDNNGNGNGFFLGGFGLYGDNYHSSRVVTVLGGATTVTLNNRSRRERSHRRSSGPVSARSPTGGAARALISNYSGQQETHIPSVSRDAEPASQSGSRS
jgi:hypothetical protein